MFKFVEMSTYSEKRSVVFVDNVYDNLTSAYFSSERNHPGVLIYSNGTDIIWLQKNRKPS